MQNERLGFLTVLASFFTPLSFVATVFGMNLREFESDDAASHPSSPADGPQRRPNVALYLEVALPITLGTFLVAFTIRYLSRRVKRRARARDYKWRHIFLQGVHEGDKRAAKAAV